MAGRPASRALQEALPHLKSSEHAAILNIVSIGAFIFAPVLSIYASMKAAMMSTAKFVTATMIAIIATMPCTATKSRADR